MIPKSNHIRYATLDKILSNRFAKNDKVNVFINLELILRKMLNKNFNKYLQVKKDIRAKELISDMVNLSAHYRAFFARNGIYSRVFMYMGSTKKFNYLNHNIRPEYREYYYKRFNQTDATPLKRLMEGSLEFTQTVLQYIDGVYYIETEMIEPSLLPGIIAEMDSSYKNIILTNDPYEYQYVNQDFMILRAKLDESHIIDKENMIRRLKLENKIANDAEVDPSYLPIILSFLGDKFRSLPSINKIGVGKAIKIINAGIEANILPEKNPSVHLLSPALQEEWRDDIIRNYQCIDIYTQIKRLPTLEFVKSQMIDRFDNVSLKQLNEVFIDFPLNLMEIQDYNTTNKPKRNVFL